MFGCLMDCFLCCFLHIERCGSLIIQCRTQRSYIGQPEYKCQYCGALFWYQERPPPQFLQDLLKFDGGRRCRLFLQKLTTTLFAFTSMGASID